MSTVSIPHCAVQGRNLRRILRQTRARDWETNLYGFLDDIRGRPNEHNLGVIESNAAGLAFVLEHEKRALKE